MRLIVKKLILLIILSCTSSYLISSLLLATIRTFRFFFTLQREPNRFSDILQLPLSSWPGILMFLFLSILNFIIISFLFTIYNKKRVKTGDLGNRFNVPKETPFGDSKFTTLKQLEYNDEFTLSSTFASSNGIILGKLDNKIVGIHPKLNQNYNTAFIGTSGGGKTQGFILPNIINAIKRGDSIVVIDPKGELFSNVYENLRDYKIKILNLKDPKHSNGIDILKYVNFSRTDILEFTNQLFANLDIAGPNSDRFFHQNAEFIMAFLICFSMEFAHLREFNPEIEEYSVNGNRIGTLGYAYDILLEYPGNDFVRKHLEELSSIASKYKAEETLKYYRLFDPGSKEDLTENFLANLKTILSYFFDKDILKMFSNDDLDLTSIIKEKTALFIIMDESSNSRNNKLGSVVLNTAMSLIEKLKTKDNSDYQQRVFFFLDEFGAIGTLKGFKSIISGCRSRDMSIIMALQGMSQLETNYPDEVDTILANCSLILGTNVKDDPSLRYLSNILGETTMEVTSTNHDGTKSTSSQSRRLMEEFEIRNLIDKNIGKYNKTNLLLDQLLFYEEQPPLNTISIEEYFKQQEIRLKKLEERRILENYENNTKTTTKGSSS